MLRRRAVVGLGSSGPCPGGSWGRLAGGAGLDCLAEPRISTTDRACAEGCALRALGAARPSWSGCGATGAGGSAVPQGQ